MKIQVQGRTYRVPALPIVAVLVVVIGAFMSMRLGRVDASDVGILINNITGNVKVRMEPGSFFYNSLYTDLHTIDKTLHTLKMRSETGDDVRLKTSDGSDVNLDVEVNYRLLLDENTLRTKVIPESGIDRFRITRTVPRNTRGRRGRGRSGSSRTSELLEAYQAKWIRDYSRSVVRYVFGTLTTEEFYEASKRTDKARESERELNRLLRPHGLEVTKVVPDKFKFYEEYETKIREKKEADEEANKQVELKEAAVADQLRQVTEAETKADVEIEVIKGQLEKERIGATAEAVRIKKGADAHVITVKIGADAEFYSAERRAKAILAAAKAEAEGLTNLAKALAGDGGRNLVLRALAEKLREAQIEGLPYTTSNVVQKLSLEQGKGDKR